MEDGSGCPMGSQALMDQWNQFQRCNPGICPQMYSCHYSIHHNRYQCCLTISASIPSMSGIAADTAENVECESGTTRIKGRCMRCNHFFRTLNY